METTTPTTRADYGAVPLPTGSRLTRPAPSLAPFTVTGIIARWITAGPVPAADPLGADARSVRDPEDEARRREGFVAGCAVAALPLTGFDDEHPAYALATLALARVAVARLLDDARAVLAFVSDAHNVLDRAWVNAPEDQKKKAAYDFDKASLAFIAASDHVEHLRGVYDALHTNGPDAPV